MDSGGRSSDAPRIEVVGSIFRSPKELRAAASKRFLEDGRGFTAENGGGHQKYSFFGGPLVAKRAKKTKPGAPSGALPQIRARTNIRLHVRGLIVMY